MRTFFTALCCFFIVSVQSQDIQVNGRFLQDSIKVGEVIPFVVECLYPQDQEVLFPDSLYDFSPFEFVSKTFAPTRLVGDMNYDSAVYYLTTFEIDSIQSLRIPVFLVRKRDSLAVFADQQSVFFNEEVKEIPDLIALKEKNTFWALDYLFNYPLLSFIIIALIIGLVIFWIVFGKRIIKKITIWKLKRAHRRFLDQFDLKSQVLHKEEVAAVYTIWKSYMEKLNKKPISKWTSKEIVHFIDNEQLKGALAELDKFVYSSKKELATIPNAFLALREVSVDSFEQKLKRISNG